MKKCSSNLYASESARYVIELTQNILLCLTHDFTYLTSSTTCTTSVAFIHCRYCVCHELFFFGTLWGSLLHSEQRALSLVTVYRMFG